MQHPRLLLPLILWIMVLMAVVRVADPGSMRVEAAPQASLEGLGDSSGLATPVSRNRLEVLADIAPEQGDLERRNEFLRRLLLPEGAEFEERKLLERILGGEGVAENREDRFSGEIETIS